MPITLLDGPLGTALDARGVPLPPPRWSAAAIRTHPDEIAAIHRDYARAGAVVHTACTFRTQRRHVGADWEALARMAVALARGATPAHHRVAGSIAPLADCYRPWETPSDPGPEHGELAAVLADAGCDLLLCETFAHPGEGVAAVRAAVATGLPVWVAFTAGFRGDLLTPPQVRAAAAAAVAQGAAAVLINCTPAVLTLPYVQALAGLGVPTGAYANAGAAEDGCGAGGAARYGALARTWVEAGATLLGGCCGTDAATLAALAAELG